MTWILIYVALCLVVGLVGMNRKMGFWGYFFASIVLSPLLGLLLVLVSGSGRPKVVTVHEPLSDQQQGAISFAFQKALREYRARIDALVVSGRITQSFVETDLEPLLANLKATLRFDASGRAYSPLDPVLSALEHSPTPPAATVVVAATSSSTPSGGASP